MSTVSDRDNRFPLPLSPCALCGGRPYYDWHAFAAELSCSDCCDDCDDRSHAEVMFRKAPRGPWPEAAGVALAEEWETVQECLRDELAQGVDQ